MHLSIISLVTLSYPRALEFALVLDLAWSILVFPFLWLFLTVVLAEYHNKPIIFSYLFCFLLIRHIVFRDRYTQNSKIIFIKTVTKNMKLYSVLKKLECKYRCHTSKQLLFFSSIRLTRIINNVYSFFQKL